MTVTKRKPKGKPDRSRTDRLSCPDFDLCVPCFLQGKQIGPHRPNHAYRIIDSHAFPIFDPDWGADEELLLIEGAEMYGLGNWADMAEHVGGRTKEECEEHYMKTYVNSDAYPLPTTNIDFTGDVEAFQARKKARLEELQSRPLALPPPKPLASAPTCHEVAGFMPGRLEFETEYENEAETLIKDLEFGQVLAFGGDSQPAAVPPAPGQGVALVLAPEPGAEGDGAKEEGKEAEEEAVKVEEKEVEPEAELELKLTVLEMFNERYDRRVMAKDFIFDRGLMNYRTLVNNEKKRSKEDRDLLNRTKVFAKVQTSQDYENFADGLLYETMLRKRIAELQEYRRMGVTTVSEGASYDTAKANRLSAKHASYRDLQLGLDRSAARRVNAMGNHTKLAPKAGPLTFASSASLHLLTNLERQLCATLRILPRPYLFLKEVLLREWTRCGRGMGAREARRAVGRDPGQRDAAGVGGGDDWLERVDRVWEFLRDGGGLRKELEGDEDEEDDGQAEDGDGEGEGEGDGDAMEVEEGDGVEPGPPPPVEGQQQAAARSAEVATYDS